MEKAIKFLGICVLLSVVIVSAALVYTNANTRYKVAGAKVFDTHTGKFVIEESPKTSYVPISQSAPQLITKEEMPQGDFSKVVIAGKSHKKDYKFSVSFTVKNNDTVKHNVHCKIVYYNKNNEPIITNGIGVGIIEPGELESATIDQNENYELIEKYELILEERPIAIYEYK